MIIVSQPQKLVNRQTAAWISHDFKPRITKQRAGFFFNDKSTILPFSNTEIVLFVFQLIYVQRIDMNDIIGELLRESDVESSSSDQTRLDSASPPKKRTNQKRG